MQCCFSVCANQQNSRVFSISWLLNWYTIISILLNTLLLYRQDIKSISCCKKCICILTSYNHSISEVNPISLIVNGRYYHISRKVGHILHDLWLLYYSTVVKVNTFNCKRHRIWPSEYGIQYLNIHWSQHYRHCTFAIWYEHTYLVVCCLHYT